jgi:hypothetical protein
VYLIRRTCAEDCNYEEVMDDLSSSEDEENADKETEKQSWPTFLPSPAPPPAKSEKHPDGLLLQMLWDLFSKSRIPRDKRRPKASKRIDATSKQPDGEVGHAEYDLKIEKPIGEMAGSIDSKISLFGSLRSNEDDVTEAVKKQDAVERAKEEEDSDESVKDNDEEETEEQNVAEKSKEKNDSESEEERETDDSEEDSDSEESGPGRIFLEEGFSLEEFQKEVPFEEFTGRVFDQCTPDNDTSKPIRKGYYLTEENEVLLMRGPTADTVRYHRSVILEEEFPLNDLEEHEEEEEDDDDEQRSEDTDQSSDEDESKKEEDGEKEGTMQ